MPIEITQPGLVELYGEAATLAGEAIRRKEVSAERARERAQRKAIKAAEEQQKRALRAQRQQQVRAIAAETESELRRLEAARESEMLQAALRLAEQSRAEEARKEAIKLQQEYDKQRRLLDAQLDLEAYERARRWEIDKAELSSRADFQRQESQRVDRLNEIDSAVRQLDKEVLAGRLSEEDVYPLKLKYEMGKRGLDVPTSLLPRPAAEEEYGVRPYWMEFLEPEYEGTPERQMAEAMMQERIAGERAGTVPYYLSPSFVRNYPAAARQAQEARGIFLSDEEFGALMKPTAITPPVIPEAAGAAVEAPQPLDVTMARQILIEAGGDKEEARRIARERGYSF